MKAIKHILAAVAALAIFTSCGLLGGLSTNNTQASTNQTSSTGINTGTALASIFGILQNTGVIDLGNIPNLVNIGLPGQSGARIHLQ